MQTVTVTFKDSRNKSATATFDVYNQADLASMEKFQRFDLLAIETAMRIGRDEWEDDETAEIEKMAAKEAGVLPGQRCVTVRKSLA